MKVKELIEKGYSDYRVETKIPFSIDVSKWMLLNIRR